jgi:aspartate aminotransferase
MARKVAREHGADPGADGVVMCVGAAGGLNVFFKAVLNPGDEVLSPAPFFVEYRAYAANHGGVLKTVASGPGFSLDPKAFAAALTPRTACVIINSPNNPTGRVYPRSDLEALAAVLMEHGKKTGRYPFLVSDEPYRDIVYGGKTVPPLLCLYPHSVVVNSYSKSLSLPGERIGYIAVSPDCQDRADLMAALIMCNRVLGFVNAPALMQKAVTRLVEVKMDMGRYERRRDMVAAGMRDAGYEFAEPEGAFYLFVKSPSPDEGAFVDFLKTYNILTVPGSAFGGPGWFRMSYAVPEASIQNAMPGFKAALLDWKSRV